MNGDIKNYQVTTASAGLLTRAEKATLVVAFLIRKKKRISY